MSLPREAVAGLSAILADQAVALIELNAILAHLEAILADRDAIWANNNSLWADRRMPWKRKINFLTLIWDFRRLSFVFVPPGITFCALSPDL